MQQHIRVRRLTVLLAASLLLLGVSTGIRFALERRAERDTAPPPQESTAVPETTARAEEEERELLYQNTPLTLLRVGNLSPQVQTDEDYTDVWYSEWDDCRYLFLPATADRSDLTVEVETAVSEMTVTLDGEPLVSGQTDIFAKKDVFALTVGGRDCGTLHVMQSDLPCVYLHPETGNTDYLDSHKRVVQTGSVLMLGADGSVEYDGALEKLEQHGNSSWDYSKKKPYNIKLPKKQSLYGMGKAKKWVLLSNYLDHSMLRNTAAEYLAEQTGIPFPMESVYVDLYSGGSYRGTYQLCEKAQVSETRIGLTDLEAATEDENGAPLKEYEHIYAGAKGKEYQPDAYRYYDIPCDPEDITGGYMVEFQLFNRYPNKTKSGFVTSRGQAVQIDAPEYATRAQVEYLRQFMQEAEDAIYSDTGYNSLGKHYSAYISTDAFALAYLMQETTENADGSYASFFLWKESDNSGDGKLHYGPVWDFDLAFRNFSRVLKADGEKYYSVKPDNFYVSHMPVSGYDPEGESGRTTVGASWLNMLCRRPEFTERVRTLFYQRFDSALGELSETYIPAQAERLRKSAEMNRLRWHMYGGKPYKELGPVNGETYDECVEYVCQFLRERRAFLQDVWMDAQRESCLNVLSAEYEGMVLTAYDGAARRVIEQTVSEAEKAIRRAKDGAVMQAVCDAAAAKLRNIPRSVIKGDFDGSRSVDERDSEALAAYLADPQQPLTAEQRRNCDLYDLP